MKQSSLKVRRTYFRNVFWTIWVKDYKANNIQHIGCVRRRTGSGQFVPFELCQQPARTTLYLFLGAHSLRTCTRHVDSTNPGRSSQYILVRPIPEVEMPRHHIISLLSL